MIMQYANNGSLFDLLEPHKTLDEEKTKKYFKQILSSVKYLHDLNICHRDLHLGKLFK
jgi:serine/threonine protein kinase